MAGGKRFLGWMRDTWAVYLVDVGTGRIEWTLGGRHSSFKFGPGAGFEWQHDARLAPGGTFSVFDDHCCPLTGAGTVLAAKATCRGLIPKTAAPLLTARLCANIDLNDS